MTLESTDLISPPWPYPPKAALFRQGFFAERPPPAFCRWGSFLNDTHSHGLPVYLTPIQVEMTIYCTSEASSYTLVILVPHTRDLPGYSRAAAHQPEVAAGDAAGRLRDVQLAPRPGGRKARNPTLPGPFSGPTARWVPINACSPLAGSGCSVPTEAGPGAAPPYSYLLSYRPIYSWLWGRSRHGCISILRRQGDRGQDRL